MVMGLVRTRCAFVLLIVAAAFGLTDIIAGPVRVSAAELTRLQPIYTQRNDARRRQAVEAAFLERIRAKGSLAVIIGLRLNLDAEDRISAAEAGAQGAALLAMQGRVAARAFGRDRAEINRYDFIPFFAARVSEAQFLKLLSDPEVASIEEDGLNSPQLSDTVPLIHGHDVLKTYGASGTGQVIAVLDTGVAKSHPMLAGKVVSEACYSTIDPAKNQTSFCPKGVRQSTAKGSGVNCSAKIFACLHGTHVASIAAGGQVGTLRGVASGAGIIAIQIFSMISNDTICGGRNKNPCIKSSDSDIVSGLNRVYALRNKFKIAAINMSLGSGKYAATCDEDFPAQAAAVAKLRDAGIAVIAASGNAGSDVDINRPACLSGAIAVSASGKLDTAKQVEYYYRNSNLNKLVRLTAPGDAVVAAVPVGTPCAKPGSLYCGISGTSQAAPHVAGAFAVLRAAAPRATIDGILSALECSGKVIELTGVEEDAYRTAEPRIDLLGAYNWLKKIPNRSWDFSKVAHAFDWSPVFAEWTVSDGQYHPDIPNVFSGYAMSATANCASSVDVTADMTRQAALGGEFDQRPHTGILLKSQFNPLTRARSGYLFDYMTFPKDPSPRLRAQAQINRIDNNSYTLLCTAGLDVPAKFNKQNTLRVVSDEATHKFYINGKLVCSAANDGIYRSGAVVMFTDFDTNFPTRAGTFKVNNVKIVSKDGPALKETHDNAANAKINAGSVR